MAFVPDHSQDPKFNFDQLAMTLDRFQPPVTLSGTSLGSGADGQLAHYVADATNGVVWTFRYRSASASGSKWEFVGGPPLHSISDTTSRTTTSGTYVALTGAMSSITIPLAGDYDIQIESVIAGAGGLNGAYLSFTVGATAANDQWCATMAFASDGASSRKTRFTSVAQGASIAEQARTDGGGTGTFLNRRLWVTPVRVT